MIDEKEKLERYERLERRRKNFADINLNERVRSKMLQAQIISFNNFLENKEGGRGNGLTRDKRKTSSDAYPDHPRLFK